MTATTGIRAHGYGHHSHDNHSHKPISTIFTRFLRAPASSKGAGTSTKGSTLTISSPIATGYTISAPIMHTPVGTNENYISSPINIRTFAISSPIPQISSPVTLGDVASPMYAPQPPPPPPPSQSVPSVSSTSASTPAAAHVYPSYSPFPTISSPAPTFTRAGSASPTPRIAPSPRIASPVINHTISSPTLTTIGSPNPSADIDSTNPQPVLLGFSTTTEDNEARLAKAKRMRNMSQAELERVMRERRVKSIDAIKKVEMELGGFVAEVERMQREAAALKEEESSKRRTGGGHGLRRESGGKERGRKRGEKERENWL